MGAGLASAHQGVDDSELHLVRPFSLLFPILVLYLSNFCCVIYCFPKKQKNKTKYKGPPKFKFVFIYIIVDVEYKSYMNIFFHLSNYQ